MIEPTHDPDGRALRSRANGHLNGDSVHTLADEAVPEPPSGAVLRPPVTPDPSRRRWLPAQLWSEFRLALRMYFDPRYRVSRTAQLLLPAILVLFAVNYFTFSVWLAIPLVSAILERAVCVLLGVVLYKVMTRELARYREVLDYLARYGPG